MSEFVSLIADGLLIGCDWTDDLNVIWSLSTINIIDVGGRRMNRV